MDMTTVFANRTEAPYRDNCCHVNFVGDDIVGAAIGRDVAAGLKSAPAAR